LQAALRSLLLLLLLLRQRWEAPSPGVQGLMGWQVEALLAMILLLLPTKYGQRCKGLGFWSGIPLSLLVSVGLCLSSG
jgi:hypothetical protein